MPAGLGLVKRCFLLYVILESDFNCELLLVGEFFFLNLKNDFFFFFPVMISKCKREDGFLIIPRFWPC